MVILIAVNYKKYGLSKVNEDYYLTFIGTLAALISSGTNVIIGFILDRISFKLLITLFSTMTGIFVILLPMVGTTGRTGFGLS